MRQRDALKQTICYRDGITLIVIPFWWNNTIESLARTIHVARPDIEMPSSLLRGDIIPAIAPQQRTKGIHGKYYPKQYPLVPSSFNASGWYGEHVLLIVPQVGLGKQARWSTSVLGWRQVEY